MTPKLWLILTALLVLPFSFAQRQMFEACTPAVGKVVLDGSPHPAISDRMRTIFSDDQEARMKDSIDWETLSREDTERRVEVMGYLKKGQLTTGNDMYYAAFIFQHGNCPEHYQLANKLADKAMKLGYSDARWIYAATLDRYLLSVGKKQKFGTQYTSADGCTYVLEPVNPKTTDAERQRFDVPPLAQAKARATGFGGDDCKDNN